MRRTLQTRSTSAERASAQAADVAARSGVEVLELHDISALADASRLFDEIWGTGPGDSYLSPSLMRALSHAGNYSAGAYRDRRLVGAVVGFLGQDAEGTYLHSHILAVSADHRGGSIGSALKQHQRAWSLANGLTRVTWTFDPLVGRNAYFNLHKLGAHAATYLENFYGDMSDDINGNDESDRLLVDWRLDDARADLASTGGVLEPATVGDATVVLDAEGTVSSEPWRARIVCATPADIVALRRNDPAAAIAWRRALRDTLGVAMGDGYRVVGFARDGWYVLERA